MSQEYPSRKFVLTFRGIPSPANLGDFAAIAEEFFGFSVGADVELVPDGRRNPIGTKTISDESRLSALVLMAEEITLALRNEKDRPHVFASVVAQPLECETVATPETVTCDFRIFAKQLDRLMTPLPDDHLTRARSGTFVFAGRTYPNAHRAANEKLRELLSEFLSCLRLNPAQRAQLLKEEAYDMLLKKVRNRFAFLRKAVRKWPAPTEWEALSSELIFEWEKAHAIRTTTKDKSAAENRRGQDSKPSHSDDFTSVNWSGQQFKFAKGLQAESVKVLWQAWEAGNHSLSQGTIGEKVQSQADRFELCKVFRRHPAWKVMIRPTGKGTFGLIP